MRRRKNTLFLAPTGSGKTLATFPVAIDALFREAAGRGLAEHVYVIYDSPLKALRNDIHKNLVEPLAQIRRPARRGITRSGTHNPGPLEGAPRRDRLRIVAACSAGPAESWDNPVQPVRERALRGRALGVGWFARSKRDI
jgi:hypothetical protein